VGVFCQSAGFCFRDMCKKCSGYWFDAGRLCSDKVACIRWNCFDGVGDELLDMIWISEDGKFGDK